MKSLIQLNARNLMKIPYGKLVPGFNSSRTLSVKKCHAHLITTFQITVNSKKTIHFDGHLSNYNTFNQSTLRGNFIQEAEQIDVDDEIDRGFRNECNKQEQSLITQLQMENNKNDQVTNEEWDTIRNQVLKMPGTINENNIDAVVLHKCSEMKFLRLGKMYFSYLKSKNKPINRACYGNYLRLFHSCKSDCSIEDLNEIIVVYKELLEVYSIIDSNTAEKAISALSITESWKEYEKLFATIKQFYSPSVYIYKIVILTAFDHHEFDLGWKLMEEMEYLGLNVPDDVFLYWLWSIKNRKVEDDLVKVLNFFNYFNIKPSDEICKGIKDAFETYNMKGKAAFTRIARNGECYNCQSKLEDCFISQEEFKELKQAFLDPVVIGKDIFLKTEPQEFERFLNFLKEFAPFDVVLDGLNIALQTGNRSSNNTTYRLKVVVKHFASLHKKILVLGRKHMASWKTDHMDYVWKNAHVFLTDNLSQDDPFMLYAAMYSDLGACFVSRDMMRGHKFLLANPKLQSTFQKWQSTHQYFITSIGKNERVYFQDPVSFLQTVQRNSKGDWHIPFVVRGEELTQRDRVDHLHRHWLCLQKEARHRTYSPRDNTSRPMRERYRETTTMPERERYGETSTIPVRERLRETSTMPERERYGETSTMPERERYEKQFKQTWEDKQPVKRYPGKINVKRLFEDDDR